MKLTKSKLKQIIKEETTRGLKEEVIDLGKYKAKKEREGMKDTVLVTKEPSYSGEHTIYDPGEFELVVVDTEEQYTALLQGDFSKAEDLGAQFDTIMFGMDPPLYEKKGKQTSQDIRRGNHRMKLTKSKLKQIIKETINEEWYNQAPEYTPEQQKVVDAMGDLIELIYDMEESNPEMTDLYIQMLRGLQQAGVSIKHLAMMV